MRDLHEAFLLRADERDSGLSVNFDCTPDECRSHFNRTYGVASLTVRLVLELELQVVPDEPQHANITGVPYKEDDPARAEYLADELARRATLVDTGKRER